MSRHHPLALALALLLLAPRTTMAQPAGHACPMQVEGTQVTLTDAPGALALAFTNGAGHADELRARVHQMAEFHNAHHAGGQNLPEGRHLMAQAQASAQDTEFGTNLVFTPTDPAQIEPMRAELTAHVEQMQSGECPMMMGMGMGMGMEPPTDAAEPPTDAAEPPTDAAEPPPGEEPEAAPTDPTE